MKQRIMWMPLLLIGILSSFHACNKKDVDNTYFEEYYYYNNSDYDVNIEAITKIDNSLVTNSYNIVVGSSFFQEREIVFGSVTGIIACSDSLVVKFGNSRQISYVPDTVSPFNILNRDNYEFTKVNENRVKYIYALTNEDFENAYEIER